MVYLTYQNACEALARVDYNLERAVHCLFDGGDGGVGLGGAAAAAEGGGDGALAGAGSDAAIIIID